METTREQRVLWLQKQIKTAEHVLRLAEANKREEAQQFENTQERVMASCGGLEDEIDELETHLETIAENVDMDVVKTVLTAAITAKKDRLDAVHATGMRDIDSAERNLHAADSRVLSAETELACAKGIAAGADPSFDN